MRVYKGQLVGGPDGGNSVSASVPRIRTQSTTTLWLDGEDKSPSTVIQTGSYYWSEKLKHFKWYEESIRFGSNRELQAA